jgi:hypothetical protein
MIPNLTIMIGAYIVFRCIESIVAQVQKPNLSASGRFVVVVALLCIAVALIVTVDTISSGASMQRLPPPH